MLTQGRCNWTILLGEGGGGGDGDGMGWDAMGYSMVLKLRLWSSLKAAFWSQESLRA